MSYQKMPAKIRLRGGVTQSVEAKRRFITRRKEMAQRTKVTIPYLREKKSQGRPITMLTAYDFPIANIEDEIGIDIILCGDSLGMTVYGFSGTNPVTMDLMIPHSASGRDLIRTVKS
jgi:hypothetical protein